MGNDRPNWFVSALRFFEALTGLRPRSRHSDPTNATGENDGAQNATVGSANIVVEPETLPAGIAAQPEGKTSAATCDSSSDQDGDQRRDLVRKLFNDFWTGIDEKPVTFAERLDAAEEYINARLTERELGWRLDTTTRKQLGLPMSSTAQS